MDFTDKQLHGHSGIFYFCAVFSGGKELFIADFCSGRHIRHSFDGKRADRRAFCLSCIFHIVQHFINYAKLLRRSDHLLLFDDTDPYRIDRCLVAEQNAGERRGGQSCADQKGRVGSFDHRIVFVGHSVLFSFKSTSYGKFTGEYGVDYNELSGVGAHA